MKLSKDKSISNEITIQFYSNNSDVSRYILTEYKNSEWIEVANEINIPNSYITFRIIRYTDKSYSFRLNTVSSTGRINTGDTFSKVVFTDLETPNIDYTVDGDKITLYLMD